MENTDYVKLVVEAKDNKAALEKLLELFNKTIRSHAKKMFFMEQCNLRRAAATGAFASGHSAEHNGHLY